MTDPRQAAIDRVDSVIHEWCSLPVDLCRCDPRPLPEPRPSAEVRVLQRAMWAERDSEPLDVPVGPVTHGTGGRAPWPPLGPMTPLSPTYYRDRGERAPAFRHGGESPCW